MRWIAKLLPCLILLTACQSGPPSTSKTPEPVSQISSQVEPADLNVYQCDKLTVGLWHTDDGLTLVLPDTKLLLSPDASDSLVSRDGQTRLTGSPYELTLNGQLIGSCVRQLEREPRVSELPFPIDFRGLGQEPGWLVEVSNRQSLSLLLSYGAKRETFDEPRVYQVDDAIHYQVGLGKDMVRLAIRPQLCQDVMSGEEFGATIELRYQGETFKGCGDALNTAHSQH